MKRSRTRVSGKGITQLAAAIAQSSSGSARVEVGFSVPDPYGNGPVNPQTKLFYFAGIPVAISSPPRVQRASTGWRYFVVDSAWMDSVKATIEAAISPNLLLARRNDSIMVYTSVDQKSITDVIGSGFRQAQGKNGVVNPCSAFTRKGDFPTFSNGSASPSA